MTSTETATQEIRASDIGTSRPLAKAEAPAIVDSGPVAVGHVSDFYHRYPGEVVTFHTRIDLREPASDLVLRIVVPDGLELVEYRMPPAMADTAPSVQVDGRNRSLVWSLAGELPAGGRYEYQTAARVAPAEQSGFLESRATVTNGDHELLSQESATIAVWAKGRYVRYLPELYEGDEFMGRLLMLFESFWAPIEMQIGTVSCYLDPRMTPSGFLPWLAGWVGLDLDERLPEERQRELIRSATWLYRRRGTKQALQRYLEIYTGGKVQIVEHRASDFRLGSEGRLGLGVALGTGNHPHTFTVTLHLPAETSFGEGEEGVQQASRYRRILESIIDAEKPAHTDYTLIVEGGAQV